jgi:ribonuclease D
MHPDAGNWIELQDYVPRFGIVDKSLQRIYANLFGEKISKNQRLSNWEAETLTEAQQLYAATDAWACVQIYNCLQEMERTGDYELINNQPIQQTTKIDEV